MTVTQRIVESPGVGGGLCGTRCNVGSGAEGCVTHQTYASKDHSIDLEVDDWLDEWLGRSDHDLANGWCQRLRRRTQRAHVPVLNETGRDRRQPAFSMAIRHHAVVGVAGWVVPIPDEVLKPPARFGRPVHAGNRIHQDVRVIENLVQHRVRQLVDGVGTQFGFGRRSAPCNVAGVGRLDRWEQE